MNKQKKKWRNIVEVPASGNTGIYGGAYTLAYVYSSKGNVLVKGYLREVKEYIEETFQKNYFVNFSLWHRGKERHIWSFWKEKVYINEADPFRGGKTPNPKYRKWEIYVGYGSERKELRFKRIPKRWVPEMEIF